MRIDSSGRLLAGTLTDRYVSLGASHTAIFEKSNTEYAQVILATNQANANGAYLTFAKSRGTTANSYAVVSSGDALGEITFDGADGATSYAAARIAALVDGTPGANDMPGRLVFSTTADGAATPTERMRIDNAGRVLVGTATANTSGAKLQTSDGITFPATAVASADVNTLDDYEEGTWTPTATPSISGTITLSSITASYTKIGNTVSMRLQTTVSAVSSPLGYIDISLPFTNSGNSSGSVFFYNGDTGAIMSNFIGRVTGNVFRITFGTGQVGDSSAPYARANTEITISAVYRN